MNSFNILWTEMNCVHLVFNVTKSLDTTVFCSTGSFKEQVYVRISSLMNRENNFTSNMWVYDNNISVSLEAYVIFFFLM